MLAEIEIQKQNKRTLCLAEFCLRRMVTVAGGTESIANNAHKNRCRVDWIKS